MQVADFGLSRDVSLTNRDFTQNIGTIAYMPPEALETVSAIRTRSQHLKFTIHAFVHACMYV